MSDIAKTRLPSSRGLPRGPRTARWVLTAAAGALLVSHLFLDVELDAATGIILIVGTLPWLGELFQSLEFPGGWKVEFRNLQQRVEKAQEDSTQAKGLAAGADRRAELALVSDTLVSKDLAADGEPGFDPAAAFAELAREYDIVREQASGARRTGQMNQIFRQMLEVGSRVQIDQDRWAQRVRSLSGGERLGAYAELYANPEDSLADSLLQSLLEVTSRNNRQPFGEYWGIVCLTHLLESAPQAAFLTYKPALEDLLTRFRPGTDRHAEMSRLLQERRQPTEGLS